MLHNMLRAAAGKRGDPFWDNVSALLHFDGADGSTTFTDETGKIWTPSGNAQIDTAQSVFGGASGLFDGAGDWISTPDHAGFEFGSGDFTLEAFVRFAGYAANNGGQYRMSIMSKDISGGRQWSFNVSGTSTSITELIFLAFSSGNTATMVSSPFSFALNTWYHVAVSRVGNLLYLSVDGTILNPGGTSFTPSIFNFGTPVLMGANNFDATYKYQLNGWVDEARITKGVGRYSADFSAPNSPFPEYA